LTTPGHLVRAIDTGRGELVVGVVQPEGVAPLRDCGSISQLLRFDRSGFEAILSETDAPISVDRLRLLPPLDGGAEVWAAGVTYMVSKEARVEESTEADVYRRVYNAERPELFFKSIAWRVVTDGEPIGIRADSPNNVPEPEVGIVLNHAGELVGLTIVDDVSSRTIEGANPLYLPQAKVYDGCCAIGPSIVPIGLISDPDDIGVEMTIRRGAEPVFTGSSSTSRLKRSFAELAGFLFHQMSFPDGVVLATGTSVVPPLTESLAHGDVVEIEIEGLGRQVTPVASAGQVGEWLARRRADPAAVFEADATFDEVSIGAWST
jgi:2-dehydro-3-deoxy-D-arabinonate dehydratase